MQEVNRLISQPTTAFQFSRGRAQLVSGKTKEAVWKFCVLYPTDDSVTGRGSFRCQQGRVDSIAQFPNIAKLL